MAKINLLKQSFCQYYLLAYIYNRHKTMLTSLNAILKTEYLPSLNKYSFALHVTQVFLPRKTLIHIFSPKVIPI